MWSITATSEERGASSAAPAQHHSLIDPCVGRAFRTRRVWTGGDSYSMAFACRRSFANLALFAPSSRLRAPKIPRPLTATLSGARSKSSEGRQHGPSAPKGRQLAPSTPKGRRPRPPSAPAAPLSEKHSESAHTADHGSAPPRQQTSSSSPPSPPSRGKRPLLEPYELSRRVIALCQRGDVDLAVAALQKAPRNAQNIKVWNTIIQQCMEARKFNLAYSVFTDVRP